MRSGNRSSGGGHKKPWPAAKRERALELARLVGPDEASRETGIPAGTVRSWLRRAAVKAAREHESDGVLDRLKAEGRRMLAEDEARRAAEPKPSR